MINSIAQLSSQDAQFLYLEADGHMTHATALSVYDPSTRSDRKPPRFKEIINHVAERTRYEPLVRQKLVRLPLDIDYPYWVEDEFFDIEAHIVHVRLPEPGDWRQLCIHMARYHSRPLNMHRPLWEMLVIEGLNNVEGVPRGGYAIATKIHHAAADGASMMRFFTQLFDIDEIGTPAVKHSGRAAPSVSKMPSPGKIVYRAANAGLRSPFRTAQSLLKVAPRVYNAIQERSRRPSGRDRPVPNSRFNAPVSQQKMFDAIEFDLPTVKRIRKIVEGATVNDVALCICSGALNRYLTHHDELPADSLVSMCPVNLRSEQSGEAAITGNNISAMAIPIFTDIEDPLQRLQAIRQETYSNKTARSATPAQLMTDLTRHVPAVTQVMASRLVLQLGIAGRMVNLFVSNVPGPPIDLYMNGAKQLSNFALAPLGEGCGLFIGITSYRDRISFNVTSTREIMPDIAFFIECLKDANRQLAAIA